MPTIDPTDKQDTLAGHGILVTRPAHQAEPLCQLIAAAGGEAIRFPVLTIEPAGDTPAVAARLARLDEYDIAIFVSANAVRFALDALGSRPWPTQVQVAAVGSATARALKDHGVPVAICPERDFNSEALLGLAPLKQVRGKRILIVRGEGGREHLRGALLARGGQVDYLEVYRRGVAQDDPQVMLERWRAGEVHAVTVTSNESLQKLGDIVGTLGLDLLRRTPLVVASARTQALARELGVTAEVIVAADATDAAMLEALCQHFRAAKPHKRTES